MWSTGEAITEALAERQELETFASAPKEVARRMLRGLRALWSSLQGAEAVEEALEALERRLEALELPVNPMDELLRRLGGSQQVAELTGRQRRPVVDGQGLRLEDRGEGANLLELEAFQSGRKQVAIITEVQISSKALDVDCVCTVLYILYYIYINKMFIAYVMAMALKASKERGRECWNQPSLRPAGAFRGSQSVDLGRQASTRGGAEAAVHDLDRDAMGGGA